MSWAAGLALVRRGLSNPQAISLSSRFQAVRSLLLSRPFSSNTQSTFMRVTTTPLSSSAYVSQYFLPGSPLALLCRRSVFELVSNGYQASCEPKLYQTAVRKTTRPSSEPTYELDWSRVWALLQPDALLLAFAVAAALASAFLNIQIPVLLGQIVNSLTAGAGLAVMQHQAARLVGVYCLEAICTASYIALLGIIGERVADRLRNDYFAAIVNMDMSFFDEHQSGDIVNRLTSDVQEFKSSLKQVISVGLRNVTQATGSLVSMYLVAPKLTGLLLVIVPAVITGGTFLGSFLRGMSRRGHDAASAATGAANEVFGSMTTVRAFGMEEEESRDFERLSAVCRRLNINLAFGIGLFTGGTHLFINGMVLGVLYYGGILMSRDEMTPGDLMRFLVSSQTIQRSLSHMSVLIGQVTRGASAGARVFEYIDIQPTIPTKGGFIPKSFEGDVEFVGVSFEYPTRRGQEVLHQLDLRIAPGRFVALCGPSGSGKSTIARLLGRFYDVTNGTVLLDGRPIQEYDPQWLRQQALGFINQEPVLFATSVMDNIRYGRPDASDEEVLQAARKANAHQFVSMFPEGYNTVLGERGMTLSGGQKQRIAIARALLKDPKILILDEATSALDAESEKLVQEALDRVSEGRTVLVIAHRLSTIQTADTIAVLREGNIVEKGTHKQLLRRKGLYADLVRHQLSGEGGFVV